MLMKVRLNRIQTSSKYCVDCGIEINPARAAIINTCRCVDCQAHYERGAK